MRIQLSIAQLIPGDTNFTNNSSGGSEPIKTSNPFYQATFNIQWSDSTDHYKYWCQQGHYHWYRGRHYNWLAAVRSLVKLQLLVECGANLGQAPNIDWILS